MTKKYPDWLYAIAVIFLITDIILLLFATALSAFFFAVLVVFGASPIQIIANLALLINLGFIFYMILKSDWT